MLTPEEMREFIGTESVKPTRTLKGVLNFWKYENTGFFKMKLNN